MSPRFNLHPWIALLLRWICTFAIPALLAIFTVVSLIALENRYVKVTNNEMGLHFLPESGSVQFSLADAIRELPSHPITTWFVTKRSRYPVWFSVDAEQLGDKDEIIEFPSRHGIELTCWNAVTHEVLGQGTRRSVTGAMEHVRAGYALRISSPQHAVICKGKFVGPAGVTAQRWSATGLRLSTMLSERQSGLIDGGIMVLAFFIVTIGLINRQRIYIGFAGWLVLHLRIVSLAAGWDIQWLGNTIPEAWLFPMRAYTMILYAVATLMLFQALFKQDIAKTRYERAFKIAEWLSIPLMVSGAVSAAAYPNPTFLPLLWTFTAYALTLMVLTLFTIITTVGARKATWFSLAMAVAFLGGIATAIGETFDLFNSVTAALASSLLAALAVAEQMRIETARRVEAQAKLAHAYEAIPIGLFTLDSAGVILGHNRLLLDIFGSAAIVEGETRLSDFISPRDCARLFERINSRLDAELEVSSLDGSKRFLVNAALSSGKMEGFLQDVTKQTQATAQLNFLAHHDPLTKVLNRRGIEKNYETASTGASATTPLCIAYLDLNRFKLINDLFGHNTGDEVLKEVCDRIKAELDDRTKAIPSSSNSLGRVGGDEFMLIFPSTGIALASLICRAIVDRISSRSYRVGEKAFSVTGSVGLIELQDAIPMKDAISSADRACVEAKKGLGDGLTVYRHDAAEMRAHGAELDMLAVLSRSGATSQLYLEMRPILSVASPFDSVNFEAVIHLRQSTGTLAPIGPLLAAAEISGQAGLIDRWALAHTLDWVKGNWHALSSTQFICVKIAGASLNDERFVQEVVELLEMNQHLTARLCIAISESVALYDLAKTRRFIEQVRDLGASVALDDFGAGFTSFSYLMELPADLLKIDARFTVNVKASRANAAIVKAIIDLARSLGMKTLAHGASDAHTVRALADIGIDYVMDFDVTEVLTTDLPFTERSAASFVADPEVLELVRRLHHATLAGIDPL